MVRAIVSVWAVNLNRTHYLVFHLPTHHMVYSSINSFPCSHLICKFWQTHLIPRVVVSYPTSPCASMPMTCNRFACWLPKILFSFTFRCFFYSKNDDEISQNFSNWILHFDNEWRSLQKLARLRQTIRSEKEKMICVAMKESEQQ